jgi:hypothetical protein
MEITMTKPNFTPKNTSPKSQDSQIRQLKARITELEAFAGVLLPVFEALYKRDGWDFSKK